jgi:hypothetical protein
LFAGFNLKVVQKAVTISGTPCPKVNKDATALVKQGNRELTIEAIDRDLPQEQALTNKAKQENLILEEGQIVTTATKETGTAKVSLPLQLGTNRKVVISQIKEDSLFANTDLLPVNKLSPSMECHALPNPRMLLISSRLPKGTLQLWLRSLWRWPLRSPNIPLMVSMAKISEDALVGINLATEENCCRVLIFRGLLPLAKLWKGKSQWWLVALW